MAQANFQQGVVSYLQRHAKEIDAVVFLEATNDFGY